VSQSYHLADSHRRAGHFPGDAGSLSRATGVLPKTLIKEAIVKRQFLAAFVGAGIVLLGLLLHERPADADAKAVPAVLRAKAIELVDRRGRVRAQLNVSPDGEVIFRLRDENGTIRAKLGADETGSGLLLIDDKTEPGIHILANRTGTSVILQRGDQRRVLTP
jgi:hypothetical protein